jgi:hypothetical protein
MPPLLDRKIRFSDAVTAIETTPKSLRKWLQNDGVLLFADAERSGWHEFSFADIVVFVIMRRAVDYGVGVVEANRLALDVVAQFPRLFEPWNDLPGTLAVVWENWSLFLWREGGAWMRKLKADWDDRDPPPSCDTYLTIKLEPAIRRALARLPRSNTEGLR